MTFKQNPWFVPVLAGLAVAAGLWIWSAAAPDPGQEVRDAVLRHLRAKMSAEGKHEGGDYTFGRNDVALLEGDRAVAETELRAGDEIANLFHEAVRAEGVWVVHKNLLEDLNRFCREEANLAEVGSRLQKRLQESAAQGVQWTMKAGNYRTQATVSRAEKGILGSLTVVFWFPKTDQGQKEGRYVQEIRYEKGTWSIFGSGQLFVAP